MYIDDAKEGAGIVRRVLRKLLEFAPTRGREGADLRTSVGDITVKAESLLQEDELGEPLDECFDIARRTGITIDQMEQVRVAAMVEVPVTVGAMLVKNSLAELCLATQAATLSQLEFTSRQDLDKMKDNLNASFNVMEEITSNDMDLMTYRAVVELHAAVMFFLIEVGYPLPRMLKYRFAEIYSSLGIAYKLYDDSGRADELRTQNKIVHPAFMQLQGKALSA